MSNRPLRLLLLNPDPIFRLGLKIALETIPHIQVVADAETDTVVWQILAQIALKDSEHINLVVWALGTGRYSHHQPLDGQFYQQLKSLYPELPVLLLSSFPQPELLLTARKLGLKGYCPKDAPLSELVTAMQEVASGGDYWFDEMNIISPSTVSPLLLPNRLTKIASQLQQNLRLSGIRQIDTNLTKVTAQLKIPGLTLIDQVILTGQRRELLAARWLLTKLLGEPGQPSPFFTSTDNVPRMPDVNHAIMPSDISIINPRALQSVLFASCVSKLQFSLQNLTDIPLEIDILREDKKRELFYIILQKLSLELDEIRDSQIELEQIGELRNTILTDLWQMTINDFFGKFARVKVDDRQIEVVNLLLRNGKIVQIEILDKIPLVMELFSYLLFQRDLQVDNNYYLAGSNEAKNQALLILENLLIQIANGVIQPLLNYLADLETIKQNFYSRKLISTREIERFRNDLSWKYRWHYYVNEAQAIFESRYEMLVLTSRGIAKTSIYAPRSQELVRLRGIPLLVTLILEFRDAIAPRLKSLLAFLGSGIVFILTQVIGRGLGLIGRGILQGIGKR